MFLRSTSLLTAALLLGPILRAQDTKPAAAPKPADTAPATTPTDTPLPRSPGGPGDGRGFGPGGPGAGGQGGPGGGFRGGRGGPGGTPGGGLGAAGMTPGTAGGTAVSGFGSADTTTTADPYALEDGFASVDLPNNSIADLLPFYELLTGKTLIKDTSIFEGAQISLVIPKSKKVSTPEAIRLVEATLLANGYVIVSEPDGKSARILPTRGTTAAATQFSQGVKFYVDAKDIPEGETLVTYFLKLTNIPPADATTMLSEHVGLNVYGRITPVAAPPGVLITESAGIVRQLIAISAVLDAPATSTSLVTKFIKLEYADASTVAQIVQAVITAQAQEKETKGVKTVRGSAQPDRPRASQNGGGDNNNNSSRPPIPTSNNNGNGNPNAAEQLVIPSSQVVADGRLNQILIVAPPEDYAYVASLIAELDKPVDVPEAFERKLNYASAIDLISPLADLLKESTGSTSLPGGGTVTQNNQPLTSSSSQLLSGRRTTNTRGATVTSTTSAGGTTSADGTSSGGSTSARPDSLIAPQEDNAPVSVLVGKTRIIADPPSNTIIVIGPKESQDKVSQLIDMLDRKPAQVYLATIIGQISHGKGSDIGFDFLTQFNRTGGGSGFTSSFLGTREDVVSGNNISDMRDNIITSAFGPAKGLNLYGQITDSVGAYVTALESTNNFKILSRPSVFALNNKKATIVSGSQIPVPYQSVTAAGNNTNGTVTTTVTYKDVVLKLEVVPLVNPNNEVTLTIAQINDTLTGTQRVEPNDIPIIGTEQIITTVTVPSGNTVVLGGLISEQTTNSSEGVPGISRIPLLGRLFKQDIKDDKRKELIIFIQPKIVNDAADLREASQSEDLRTAVGADAAQRFPNFVNERTIPTILDDKKPNWWQRNFKRNKVAGTPSPTTAPLVNPLR